MNPGDMADEVVELGRLALVLGRVERITYHEDGETRESDADHTVMLGLVACQFAAEFMPTLNLGIVAEYALVHDLVEVFAGDTPTLRALSPEERQAKKDREAAAQAALCHTFPGWLAYRLVAYEAQADPEALYVWAMDKLLPKITHILNGGVTLSNALMGWHELAQRYGQQEVELGKYAAEYPALMVLREELVVRVLDPLVEAASD